MSTRLPTIFVLVTIVLDAMGIGLIMPVMPELIMEVGHADLSGAAVWGGLMATAFAVMQFIFGPTLGNLSDRYGRRPVLLFSLFFMAVDYLVMSVAGTLWLLFAGRVIGGITAATQSTAYAFMADVSRAEDKARNFGLISAGFGVGFVLGPLVGGFLAEFGSRAPFLAAAALAGANFVFGWFVMPETVTDRIRRPFEWRRANPFGAFFQIGRIPGLPRLVIVYFLWYIAFFVYPAVWAYYTAAAFGWDPRAIGISLAAYGTGMAIAQGFLVGPAVRWLGEHRSVLIGMSINIVIFTAYVFITEGWQVFVLVPLSALAAIATPAMMGIMSRTVPDNQQGELQGINSSVGALAIILSPLLMTQTFAAFTGPDAPIQLPGAPFALSALMMLLCVVIFMGRERLHGANRA